MKDEKQSIRGKETDEWVMEMEREEVRGFDWFPVRSVMKALVSLVVMVVCFLLGTIENLTELPNRVRLTLFCTTGTFFLFPTVHYTIKSIKSILHPVSTTKRQNNPGKPLN